MSDIKLSELNGVEIVSVGRWKGSRTVDITGGMLDDMVRAFNELSDKVTGFRPPLKLGHEDAQRFIGQNEGSGAPALGWVKAMRRIGDKVVADFSDVPSSLLDMIKRRLYNHVSIELLPSLEYGGNTFANVLTAVALLGAELPAVKGLKELSATLFEASGTEAVTLSEKEEGHEMANENAKYDQTQVDALIEAALVKERAKLGADHQTALTEATAKVTAAVADLKKATEDKERAEVALQTFKADADKASIVGAVDAAIKDGRVTPAEKDGLVAMGQSMTGKIKFGDKEKSGFDAFKDMLTARPKAVKFGEKLNGKGDVDNQNADAGIEVDRRAKEKITAAGADKLAYKDAVHLVLTEDEGLKNRYALSL